MKRLLHFLKHLYSPLPCRVCGGAMQDYHNTGYLVCGECGHINL